MMTTAPIAAGHTKLRVAAGLATRDARATFLLDDARPMAARTLVGRVRLLPPRPLRPGQHGANRQPGGDERQHRPLRALRPLLVEAVDRPVMRGDHAVRHLVG